MTLHLTSPDANLPQFEAPHHPTLTTPLRLHSLLHPCILKPASRIEFQLTYIYLTCTDTVYLRTSLQSLNSNQTPHRKLTRSLKMDTTHQGDRNKKSSRWKFLGKKTKSHANAPDPVTRDSGYGTSDHYPSGASSVGDNEHTYDQPQVGDELEDPDTGEVVVVTTTTTTTTTTSTRGGKQREIPTQEIVRDVRTEETRIPAGASGPHHNATINQSNLPVFEHVSSRGNDIHDATTTLTHAPVTTGTTTGVSGPIDEPYATHSTTDSPAIPEKSSKRLSQDYTRPAPITDPAAGIDTPPSPNRHNFSYPSRQAPGTHQHTSGYDNDPVSPISTATTQPGSAMDAHNRYRPQQSTLSNLKSAAAGIHVGAESLFNPY